jgi:hypothetical protein
VKKYKIGTYLRYITEGAGLPFPENNVSYVVGIEKLWTIFADGKQMLLSFKTKKEARQYYVKNLSPSAVEKEIRKLERDMKKTLKAREMETRKWFKQNITRVKKRAGVLK